MMGSLKSSIQVIVAQIVRGGARRRVGYTFGPWPAREIVIAATGRRGGIAPA